MKAERQRDSNGCKDSNQSEERGTATHEKARRSRGKGPSVRGVGEIYAPAYYGRKSDSCEI